MPKSYPALKVRDFLWKHQLTGIIKETVQTSLDLNPTDASDFLSKLVDQGLIKESHRQNGYPFFDLTDCGVRLAYASAAKPIHRRTAERILSEFMERVNRVNATPEYLYRVDGVILFGSFLGAPPAALRAEGPVRPAWFARTPNRVTPPISRRAAGPRAKKVDQPG